MSLLNQDEFKPIRGVTRLLQFALEFKARP